MVYVFLAVFGLVFGSFINALVWRIHEQRELANVKRPNKKRAAELSMTKGRSMCSKCGHMLAAKDLVPLFSWLGLRGRCRYCKQPISDSPVIEIVLPLLFCLSYWLWPYGAYGPAFGAWLVALVLLLALAYYDLQWFILPDRLVFSLIAVSLVYVGLTAGQQANPGLMIQAAIGALIMSGLFFTLYRINHNWIGFGDVKLAIALGLLAGTPLAACLVLFISSLIGTFLNIGQLRRGKAGLKHQVPFGPLLVAGTVIVVIAGPYISRYVLLTP